MAKPQEAVGAGGKWDVLLEVFYLEPVFDVDGQKNRIVIRQNRGVRSSLLTSFIKIIVLLQTHTDIPEDS